MARFVFKTEEIINAERLETKVKATMHANGQLSFTLAATRVMQLERGRRIIFFPNGEKDLVAVVMKDNDDKRGFTVRTAGPYHYLNFRTFMEECGVEYKKNTVIYDITPMSEKFEGCPAYRFERRDIVHADESVAATAAEEDAANGND